MISKASHEAAVSFLSRSLVGAGRGWSRHWSKSAAVAADRTSAESFGIDDLGPPNVFASGIPFFGDGAMCTVRVAPLLYREVDQRRFVGGKEGSIFFTFYRRVSSCVSERRKSVDAEVLGVQDMLEASGLASVSCVEQTVPLNAQENRWPSAPSDFTPAKFDTAHPLRVRVRGINVGAILELDARQLAMPEMKPATIPIVGSGTLSIGPLDSNMLDVSDQSSTWSSGAVTTVDFPLALTARVPRRKVASPEIPEKVSVPLTTGQLKTLQTVLGYVAPSFWGWQVLLDPQLVSQFMEKTLQESAGRSFSSTDSFFDKNPCDDASSMFQKT